MSNQVANEGFYMCEVSQVAHQTTLSLPVSVSLFSYNISLIFSLFASIS